MKEKTSSLSAAFKPTKHKIIIFISILTVAALMAGFVRMGGAPAGGGGGNLSQTEGAIRLVTLERGDLASTISATGTVYSTKTTEVYSSLSYPVKTINISVGDKVSEGDVLCELDSATLETDIAQKQASLSASQLKAQQNLATAQQDLDTYKKNVENDYDTTIYDAKAAVASAERDVELKELDLQSAGNKVRTARRNLQDARNGEGDYEEWGGATDAEIEKLRDTLSDAETTLEKAQTSLDGSEASLEKAKVALKAAEERVNNQLISNQNSVKTAQLNNNFDSDLIAMDKLLSDLEKCKVKAPVSGTVTAVKAVEGASGSGLLFVIQDTERLKVITNIKEYDVGSVNVGDKAVIKSDATGDTEFSGALSSIAPTSTITATGTASASTEAEFESEVAVNPGAQGLLIGMNTRLSIITEERKNVFFVPYEAVGTGFGESSYIYVASAGEDGKESYARIPVQTGLETNLYIEISGDELREGMQVVRSAQSVPADMATSGGAAELPGAGQREGGRPAEGEAQSRMPQGGGMPGGGQSGMPGGAVNRG